MGSKFNLIEVLQYNRVVLLLYILSNLHYWSNVMTLFLILMYLAGTNTKTNQLKCPLLECREFHIVLVTKLYNSSVLFGRVELYCPQIQRQ